MASAAILWISSGIYQEFKKTVKNMLPLLRYHAKMLNHRSEVNDMIAIIDYDAGNLRSVEKALISLGEAPVITRVGIPYWMRTRSSCRGWVRLAMPWAACASTAWWM